LLANELKSTDEIMQPLSVSRGTVVKWRHNFIKNRLDALKDTPRSGRKPVYNQEVIAKLIAKTIEPPEHMTHWQPNIWEHALPLPMSYQLSETG